MLTPSATFSSEVNETAPPESSDDELLIRRRKHRTLGSDIVGLNLTAMMDVMTILLVFLLQMFAAAPENMTGSEDLTPPKSISQEAIVPGVKLLVSKAAVLVDDKVAVRLTNGVPEGGSSMSDLNAWTPVAQALATRRDIIIKIGTVTGAPFDGSLMVIADQDTPYEVINNVLYQAGKEQFTQFRLIVRSQ
jgi:biopolymer transport protein ExbD